jgi:hypothetical protein
MTRTQRLCCACATLIVALSTSALATTDDMSQAAAKAAAQAAKESPALVDALAKEIGSTPEQAAGAAGALFNVAKSRLSPADFTQVANAVPGMTSLLGAAPAAAAGSLTKTAGGLAAAASAFSSLGLKPELVAKAIPILTSFVTKSGGASVGSLLAGALK